MAFTIPEKTDEESANSTDSSSSSAKSSTSSASSATTTATTTSHLSWPPLTYRDFAKATTDLLDLSKFAELPYDLRAAIWEATFVSRLIPLVCETVELGPDFDPPFKHITISRSSSYFVTCVNVVESSSFLTCRKLASPAALSVNRESRQIALGKYRPWKMFNKELKFRNIMWCPGLDTVDLLRAVPGSNGPVEGLNIPPLPLIEKQFPSEVGEIQTLAVPSSLWGEGQHKNIDVIWPLIDFVRLKELVVVLQKNKEREFAYYPERGLSTVALTASVESPPNWTIPEDIEIHIKKIRRHYEKFGPERLPLKKKPDVTIVDSEHKVFGDQDMRLLLRCRPCPYLGVRAT